MKILKRFIFSCLFSVFVGYLIFSYEPLIQKKQPLSAEQVRDAKDVVKNIIEQFTSTQTSVEITLDQNDINSLRAIATHTLEKVRFESNLSQLGLVLSTTITVELWFVERFINVYCLLMPGFEGFEIDSCRIGSIPVPGFFVQWLSEAGVSLLFGNDVEKVFIGLLEQAEIKNNTIIFTATKLSTFKDDVKSSIKDVVNVARIVSQKSEVNLTLVQLDIDYLEQLPQQHQSLSFYVSNVFSMIYKRVELEGGDIQEENTAALWALIIVFGNPEFSKYIGIDHQGANNFAVKTLRGRADLNLHFLYSIFLEQLGRAGVGLKIGEVKELLDTNKGGSGFSFADLAADKAGLYFSQQLTENKERAQDYSGRFIQNDDEGLFFPFVHDLPEGFADKDFKKVFQHVDSAVYLEMEKLIDNRITALPLYHEDHLSQRAYKLDNLNNQSKNGYWLTVDTHIHSKFSDGDYGVSEIAQQAIKFGCDAIAITDHGDKELLKVASPEYFDTILQVDRQYPELTVIPALEWNIPPFNGREHATVLLPEHSRAQQDLFDFRHRYDHWQKKDKKLLTAKEALQWLESNTTSNGVKPTVIYNHPSRKDYQSSENKHDFVEWQKVNNIVTGFSGAPGRQKKRGDNNGSYDFVLKTINGWDPAVAKVGGVWDQLLQEGYQVGAARAASDFHNTRRDYWPCQFSTTHLFAKNKQQNSIIQAFQQGNHWAQQGKFVHKVNVNVQTKSSKATGVTMGQTLVVKFIEPITVNLSLELNDVDWRGFNTTLDEVELIVITEDSIKQYYFEPELFKSSLWAKGKVFNFKFEYRLKNDRVAFRWRGRSIQPEKHHYMFYSNPVYLSLKDK